MAWSTTETEPSAVHIPTTDAGNRDTLEPRPLERNKKLILGEATQSQKHTTSTSSSLLHDIRQYDPVYQELGELP